MPSDTGSFTLKQLEVKITLRKGEFSEGGNTKTLTEIPIHVRVEKTGPPDFCKATVEIIGMKYEDMDKLTTLAFKPLARARNIVAIYAGNEKEGKSLVFQGEITSAIADFNSSPDVSFKLEAKTGFYGKITAQGPTAIKGYQPCAAFCEMLAKGMGYTFKNDGVTASLNNSIFNGSPVDQARTAARQVGAELLIEDDVVTLTPLGGNGDTGKAFLLKKDTGLLGYPTITQDGIDVKAIYNPAFKLNTYVKVESIVPGATGFWRIIKLSHDLQAYDSGGGPWQSNLHCMSIHKLYWRS